ncbi:MAG: hypothetical protein HY699_14585 [Deltaproteobacteria bacterium]|nr:hypothetical protein [Deltaproteobacteria bacterium]
MANSPKDTKAEPRVADRWWVEAPPKQRAKEPRPPGPAGSSFFTVAIEFDQESARERLTDSNLKLLQESDPPPGSWGYVQLAETKFPARELERIKQMIALPPYARATVVDCGRTIRVLATGSVIGERIIELTLGETPSLDCWVEGDWVHEELYDHAKAAVRAFRRLLEDYLSPAGIATASA